MVTSKSTRATRTRTADEAPKRTVEPVTAQPVTAADLRVERHADKWFNFFWSQRGTSAQAVEAGIDRVRDAVRLMKAHPELNQSGNPMPKAPQMKAALDQRKKSLDEGTARRVALHVGTAVQPGDIDVRALRRFMESTEADRRIEADTAWLVVDYLVRERVLPVKGARAPGYDSECGLAAAMIAFFNSNSATRDQLPVQFQGSYLTYRRSVHWPGAYVKGSLVIEPVEIPGHMLEPSMKEKAYAMVATELHVHDGGDGSAPAREVYVGVLSRKATYPFILSSLSGPDRVPRGAPRFTLFHTTVYEEAHKGVVASMTGTAVTPHGQRQGVTADVCVERFSHSPDQRPDEKELGLFMAGDRDEGKEHKPPRIPPSVVARLSAGE